MKRKLVWGDISEDPTKVKLNKILKIEEQDNIYAIGTQIHFTGEINSDSIEKLIKVFTDVIKENKVEHTGTEQLVIEYIVDSPGGSVTDVLKFVDFLDIVRAKHPHVVFTSIITGLVASAGTVMCVASDHRFMTPNAFAMIHELSSGKGGQYTQLMSYATFIQKMHNKLVKIYSNKTPLLNTAQIEALLQKESWFDAEEYKKLGFIDGIRPIKEKEILIHE